MRAASGSTTLGLGSRDETWDAAAARKALHPDDYGKAFFWRDPNGDPETLAAYKLPFASPGGGLHAVWAGVTAAAAMWGDIFPREQLLAELPDLVFESPGEVAA